MSKNTTITIITLAIILLAGFSIYQFTNSNHNNSSGFYNSMDQMMGRDGDDHDGGMMMGMSNMADSVKDDQSFLEEMIPHHQEAVETSKVVLNSTKDAELKSFVQNVIIDQEREINQMKTWYKDWFNKDYTINTDYEPMMTEMNNKTGTDLDKAYIRGMIMHHQGAIEMANKIKTMTQRQELITLANNIISSQTKERNALMDWMMTKFDDHTMMGM
jgi:uncharacterized protein (DUF305 family)